MTICASHFGNRPMTGALLAAGITLMAHDAVAQNSDTIRIGTMFVTEGALASLGQEANRGLEIALAEFNGTIAGKKIVVFKEGTNATPDLAVQKARKLIEQDKVDVIVGPLSGGEGLAVKEYAKTVPSKTFVNGAAASQDTTMRDPAPNLFSFRVDGAQMTAGLGKYVYDEKKYRNVAIVAEDYAYPYTQVAGFVSEFCGRGGKIADRYWVPLGTKDYSSVIARIPSDVDAVYVVVGGADAVNFLSQYYQTGGKAPLIGGSITVDSDVLNSKGSFRSKIIGILSSSNSADESEAPEWQAFAKTYRARFPDGLPAPSSLAAAYYISMKAMLLGLQAARGDVSGNQDVLKEALRTLKFDTPTGPISLDQNRQAIADNFLMEVTSRPDGSLYNKVVKVVPQVNATLNMPREPYIAAGAPSRTNPPCRQVGKDL
jgi:branched-chain amino acid transport system substrate-binding protein